MRERPLERDPQGIASAWLDLPGGGRLFSFVLDGKSSDEWLPQCRVTSEPAVAKGGVTLHRTVYRWPESGLEITQETRGFPDTPAVEWLLWLRNGGDRATGLLEAIRPLDLEIACPPGVGAGPVPQPNLYFWQDYAASIDDFMLRKETLRTTASIRLSGQVGRTRQSPFANLQVGDEGIILGAGWTGRWELVVARPERDKVHLWVGMPETRLKLCPGETIRTPRVLVLPWKGTTADAHNALRRLVLGYYTPQVSGRPAECPLSFGSWGGMKTANHLRNIELIREHRLDFDVYWVDAGWYGPAQEVAEYQDLRTEDWFYRVGDWRVNPAAHPQGLKPISDAAHAAGMKLLLWFDPERAVEGVPLTKEHPEWFFPGRPVHLRTAWTEGRCDVLLFNFGNPDARRWMTDLVSAQVAEAGIDVLRHDCNCRPEDYLRDADEPGRTGMAAIRYAEGLLEFWDELRRRHPGLLLDVCVRADLETMTRALDLTRSEYPIYPDSDAIGNQVETYGLAHWRPLSGTTFQMRPGDAYYFRSAFGAGLMLSLLKTVSDAPPSRTLPPDYPWEWLRTMIAQFRRAQPFFSGDFYPLTEGTASTREWLAYQLERPDLGAGVVVAFRRQDSPFVAARFPLHGLTPGAEYTIEDVDAGKTYTVGGQALMGTGLDVTMEKAPDSRLLFYNRAG